MPAARIGTACTDAKPASVAAWHETRPPRFLGPQIRHRQRPPRCEALQARALVGLQLEQLQLVGLLGRCRHQMQLPQGIGEEQPRGGDVEELRAVFGQLGQQLDDVEVLQQAVHQGDDGVQHAGLARYLGHQPSASRSRWARISRATSVAVFPVAYACARRRTKASAGPMFSWAMIIPVAWLTSARDSAVSSAQASLSGSADGGLQVLAEEIQHRNPGQVGGDERTGEMFGGQAAGPGLEEVECAGVLTADDHRHRIYAADPVGQHRRAVRRPAHLGRVGEIDHHDRRLEGHRVQARTLSVGELQLVVEPGLRPTRAECAGGRTVENQRERRTLDVEQLDARLAQPVGSLAAAVAAHSRRQLIENGHDVSIHHGVRPIADFTGAPLDADASQPR